MTTAASGFLISWATPAASSPTDASRSASVRRLRIRSRSVTSETSSSRKTRPSGWRTGEHVELEAPIGGPGDAQPHRRRQRGPFGHRAARALAAVGGQDLVAAAAGRDRELLAEPAVGMADGEAVVDELEPLPEAIDEPLVELLQRGRLAAGAIEHDDDDREDDEIVDEHTAHIQRDGVARSLDDTTNGVTM